MLFTAEHEEPRRTLQRFIASEINPHVDEWEAAGQLPTHALFKKLGDLGFLGLNKPVEFGGADALRREFLAPAISGDVVACVGVSEPDAGSDVAEIRTNARSDGDDYVI